MAGGLAFLMVVTMGRAIGMTRMNFLEVLGTMMTPAASKSTAYGIGLAMHLTAPRASVSPMPGALHAIGVSSVGQAAGWDLLIGMGHGVSTGWGTAAAQRAGRKRSRSVRRRRRGAG